ncbi:MAG: phosphoadenylyl-sulfate reductase [Candidatus Velthaea sp.]
MTSLSSATAAAGAAIRVALEAYPSRVALSCSFGGPSGMVLLDLALREEPRLPVFFIDTGLLFPASHLLVATVEERYGIRVEAVVPHQSVEEQAAEYGEALWRRDPDACCALRKVEPLRRFLQGYDVWMTAVRREQTADRRDLQIRQWDDANAVVKLAPLAFWSDDLVWEYVRAHGVPVNPLHADGYPSLGCLPCTRRVASDEDVRAGRWPDFTKTECGIHV